MIALYARVSTDAQVDKGLPSQLAELRRFVKEKYSGQPCMEFADDGYPIWNVPSSTNFARRFALDEFGWW